jgi:quinol monooxygenase YgiN
MADDAAATSEIVGIARLRIRPGKLEEFKRLAAECMESARTRDTGTLQYDWFISEDAAECVVHERYRDSASLIEHTSNLGALMRALLETCSVSGEVFGRPSPELRKALERSGVRIYSPYQSGWPR